MTSLTCKLHRRHNTFQHGTSPVASVQTLSHALTLNTILFAISSCPLHQPRSRRSRLSSGCVYFSTNIHPLLSLRHRHNLPARYFRRRAQPFHQRANASSPVWGTGVFNVEDKVHNAASTTSTQLLRPQEQTPSVYTLPLAPRSSLRSRSGWRGRYPSVAGDNRRSSSPALSSTSSSAVSAATTSATFSSRSSLSSCRSSVGSISQYTRRGSVGKRRYLGSESSSSSSRSSSRPCVPGGSDYFPTPSPWAGVDGRRRRSDGGRRERSAGRELNRHRQQREKQGRRYASDSRKDYASEASTPSHDGRRCGSRDQGMKRSRSGSRERGSRRKKAVVDAGIECSRCTERCRVSRERSTITRTLPVSTCSWDLKSPHRGMSRPLV